MTCDHDYSGPTYAVVLIAGETVDEVRECRRCGLPRRIITGPVRYSNGFDRLYSDRLDAHKKKPEQPQAVSDSMQPILDSIRQIIDKG